MQSSSEQPFNSGEDRCVTTLITAAKETNVLQTTQNLAISRCCFAEDGKEMYKEL